MAGLVQLIKNNIMKINLEKLSKLENQYSNSPITLTALQNMVLTATSINFDGISSYCNIAGLALNTLSDLGVIEIPKTNPEQLNS